MKKFISITLVCVLLLSLCACTSMDKFKDNLGRDYKKTKLSDDDIECYADLLDLDISDYKIDSAIEARHRDDGISVLIFECGSRRLAKKLAKDAEDIIDILEDTYGSSYTFAIETKSNFVLIGEENAIDDAL